MQRTWNCELCTFKNKGGDSCALCHQGQPPPSAGEWRCKHCTLLNKECVMVCAICNHRKPKRKHFPKLVAKPQIASNNQNQQYNGIEPVGHYQSKPAGGIGNAISFQHKPPVHQEDVIFHRKPAAKQESLITFHRKPAEQPMDFYEDMRPNVDLNQGSADYNRKQAHYNRQPVNKNRKPRECAQRPLDIFQGPLDAFEKPVQIWSKPVRNSLDIDIDLPSDNEGARDSLITIRPKQPLAVQPLNASPPPYSTPPPELEHWANKKEDKEDSLHQIFMKPLPNLGPLGPQRPSPVGMIRNAMDVDLPDDDEKHGKATHALSSSPFGKHPLAQAIEEDHPVTRKSRISDNLGTEELIRKLMQEEMCQVCYNKQGIEVSGCNHKLCQSCGKKNINDGINSKKWASQAVTCPIKDCKNILPQNIFRYFDLRKSTLEELERMQQKFNMSQTDGLVRCPSDDCGYTFVGEPGKVMHEKNEVGRDYKPITEVALRHKAKHRFRCPQCQCNFCGECSASPYHVGDTCESYVKWKESKKCRYCESTIDPRKITHKPNWQYPGWDNVCHMAECQER